MNPLIKVVLLCSPFFTGVFSQNPLQQNFTAIGITAFFPGDSNYASASKAYNLRYTFQPAAVAFPKTDQDVASIIQTASANGMNVVARGGGHSYIANGLGGKNNVVVIDMSDMKSITVNPGGTAVIQMGSRLGDVALALNGAGRALPHGTCSYVGIGGHSGHGGYGFTSRMWGLTLDTIQSMNVVLSNGTLVTASSTSNPDLFWAMRGAASSFGITTSITVQTFPAPSFAQVFSYQWQLTASKAVSAIAAYQSFAQSSDLPAEIGTQLVFAKGNNKGSIFFQFSGGWYGSKTGLNSTIAPFLAQMPTPDQSSRSGNGTYIDSVNVLSGTPLNTESAPDGTDTFYAKSLMTPQGTPMTTAAITAYVNYLANQGFDSDTNWFIEADLYGGVNSKINSVPLDNTAFAKRDTLFTFQLYASSSNSQPPYPSDGFSFVDGMVSAITSNMPSDWNYAAYLNYIDDRLSNFQSLYYGSHYPRLQSIKAAVDPKNLFTFPTAVQLPGSSGNTTDPSKLCPGASSTTCVTAPSNADGGSVVVKPCDGSASQSWKRSGNTWVIYGNKCLDVTDGLQANGNKMQIWTCSSGNANQNFSYDTSSKAITWTGKGQCLDLTDGKLTSGNPLQIWACANGNPNQAWNFV